MRAVVLALAVLLAGAAPADAWLAVPVVSPLPPVVDAPCPTAPAWACTSDGGPIYIDLSGYGSIAGPAKVWRTYAHELGHHFDYRALGDSQREQLRYLMGETRPWRMPPNSPHEKFAEAYSLCALGTPHENRLRVGRRAVVVEAGFEYRVTLRRHRRICQLIARAGALAGLGAG